MKKMFYSIAAAALVAVAMLRSVNDKAVDKNCTFVQGEIAAMDTQRKKIINVGTVKCEGVEDSFGIARFIKHGGTDGTYKLQLKLDTTFNKPHGFVRIFFDNFLAKKENFIPHIVRVQPDGKFIIGASIKENDDWHLAVIRYSDKGVVDTSFGGRGLVLMVKAQQAAFNWYDQYKAQQEDLYQIALKASGIKNVDASFETLTDITFDHDSKGNILILIKGMNKTKDNLQIRLDEAGNTDRIFGFMGLKFPGWEKEELCMNLPEYGEGGIIGYGRYCQLAGSSYWLN